MDGKEFARKIRYLTVVSGFTLHFHLSGLPPSDLKLFEMSECSLTMEENTWEEKKRRIRKKWSPYFDWIKEDEAKKDVHWKLWTPCPWLKQ
ncbi:UNVERIFIED_CONTAM: hypothetical protein K2H54_056159 [Gekko kuhli]